MLSPAAQETGIDDRSLALMQVARPAEAGKVVADDPTCAIPVGKAERKFATVLFIDIKGSMHLSDGREPEEWWSTIDELFELMCEGVYQFGGWVAGFTGDGISAVFDSAPGSNDHAKHACHAALWLREAIRERALKLHRQHGYELAVRLGINSGDIVVGTIGDRYKRFHTATGYPIGLAKRMETIAEVGRIYMTQATGELVERDLLVRSRGVLMIKGAPAPVEAFELVGHAAGASRSRTVRATHRPQSVSGARPVDFDAATGSAPAEAQPEHLRL
jgi:class 3 adenylate cyclase